MNIGNNTQNIPQKLYAGDALGWTHTFEDFDPNLAWTLSYVLINSANKITIVATPNLLNKNFDVAVLPAATAAYVVGNYKMFAVLSDATNKYTFELIPTFEIKPNLLDVGTLTITKTHAENVLDSIKAVIENRATLDQMSYSIAGRSLSRMNISDLLKFKEYYQNLVKKEQESVSDVSGKLKKNRLLVKF